jgi:hypothetical protein
LFINTLLKMTTIKQLNYKAIPVQVK